MSGVHYEAVFGENGDLFLLIEAIDVPGCARLFATLRLSEAAIVLRVGERTLRLPEPDAALCGIIRDMGGAGICEIDARTGEPVHVYRARLI